MYACLGVTCHLHFWQYDRDFLRATVVTRGWNGYRSKSQHRKSTLEKKILPPFQQGFEPATFQSRVRCSNHWAIPAPHLFFPVLFLFDWVGFLWPNYLRCQKLCAGPAASQSKYWSASGPSLLRSPSPPSPHGFNYDISKTSLLYRLSLICFWHLKTLSKNRTNERTNGSVPFPPVSLQRQVVCLLLRPVFMCSSQGRVCK